MMTVPNAVTIGLDEASAIITAALIRSRTSPENAAAVARALVGAELAGQAGHGLRRVPSYCAQAAAGKIDGFASPVMTRIKPGSVIIDAAHGFAYPALEMAVQELPDLAQTQGIATVGINRSHHSGVAGLPVTALAHKGIVALMVGNSPPAIAPWGSNRPLFGTNPIAFAAPVPGADPIVIDVSLSRVARGKIMAAAQAGKEIPEGWAFDADGHPTTDAAAAMAGTMAPLGDAKGTALALMVELLCAGLTGANYAFNATSFFDDQGAPPGVGQLLIGIDPGAFGDGALERFAMMAATIEGAPGARLPGRRRQDIAKQKSAEGLSVDQGVLDAIDGIGNSA
jgi:(2R)-3-sulfolactate dehydrogenase (NADP+)